MNAKKLFTHISLVIFMLLIATTGFSKEKFVKSKWTAQPLTIDGLDDDWSEDVLTTKKKKRVDYAVRNDAQNIYVLFVFKDPKFLSSINFTGITLYFNTEGKKKKDHGFLFTRKQVTADELIAYLEKKGQVLTEEQRQGIKTKLAYIVYMAEIAGDKGKEASEATQTPGTLRPAFKINKKGENVIYEFRVPLAKAETSPGGIGADPGQSIKIGFEWGGMTDKLRKMMSARTRSKTDLGVSRESTAGGRISTTRGQSKAPRPGRPSMAIPKKHSFWIDVKLAQNQ